MANPEHLAILKQGVEVWNKWRAENPDIKPDLNEAKFKEAKLSRANLSGVEFYSAFLSGSDFSNANLSGANLVRASLFKANLREANLSKANLRGANLTGADLTKADLSGARFFRTTLIEATLKDAILLDKAYLEKADLTKADLRNSQLNGANFTSANLNKANFEGANLSEADLSKALLVETIFNNANLTNSRVYGISAWNLELKEANQKDLIITQDNEPVITVDNLEVAQFVYLLLHNAKIRDVIDTIGKKAVLIIGRFTEERKAILHAIRDELRDRYNLLPIMFEFEPLSGEPTIKTLSTLAHLSRFVIADLTDAKSVLQELTTILKDLPTLPVKPIIHESDSLPPMGDSFMIMQSMLKPYVYTTKEKLLSDLQNEVIDPAEGCVKKFDARLAEIRQEWFPWQRK